MNDCPVVGGRKYDVECGLVRRSPVGFDWVPMWSDWVISHTVLFVHKSYVAEFLLQRRSNLS